LELKRTLSADLDRKLDILVNNAGIQIRHPVLEFPIEDWDTVIELNLTAAFDLAQWAAAMMVRQGKGKIINIAAVYLASDASEYVCGIMLPVDGGYLGR